MGSLPPPPSASFPGLQAANAAAAAAAAATDVNLGVISPATVKNISESCAFKSMMSGVAGAGIGGLVGMFLSSADFSTSREMAGQPLRTMVAASFKDMFQRSYTSAKGFALVALLFSSSECIIESFRAKSDIYNSVAAGCLSGGVLAHRAGPAAAAGGCASFAAFSAAIDLYMTGKFTTKKDE